MAWRGHRNEIAVNWKPDSLARSFTGVFEALAVLLCSFVHYIVFRVLRRSGLDAPCSCKARFRKNAMPSVDSTIGLKENNRAARIDSFSKEAALKSCAELVTTGSGVESRNLMANSRCEAGDNDRQHPIEDLTNRAQQDIDKDQDLKDRELLEALQRERETLAALYSELEQERNFSATAASEALAMISRLQEEKAAVQMEARQFERMVLEKAMYDQEEIEALNEMLVSREEEKIALEEEIRVCREKLDSVVKEERRQSLLMPKAKTDGGIGIQKLESPILVKNEKIVTTPRAGKDGQSKYVDKFSTSRSELLTALVQDGGRGMEGQLGLKVPNGIRRKDRKSKERDDGKPEFPGFINLKKRWGSQDVMLKTLEQTKEERRIEDERRLSVLEYVMKFEQQQQHGKRFPVQIHSVTKHPNSTGDSRSKTRSDDVEASISSGNDESSAEALTTDDSLRRRLFEDDCGEEQMVSASLSVEEVEDGGRRDERPSCLSAYESEFRAGEVCRGTDNTDECAEKSVFVHDVYEVQKSPNECPALVMGDAEMQPVTPSDRLGKPDLQTFGMDEEREYLCMINPSHLQEMEDAGKDSHWEDLQGKVKYKTLRVSKSLITRDNTTVDVKEDVLELTKRLKALEADKYFMKQTIEALRRENVEMKLLQCLSQQSLELRGIEQQELWRKRMPMTLQIQDLMSFTRLRTTARAHLNTLAQACQKGAEATGPQAESSVGLSRLLQPSPKGLAGTCLTRVRKAEEIIPSVSLENGTAVLEHIWSGTKDH